MTAKNSCKQSLAHRPLRALTAAISMSLFLAACGPKQPQITQQQIKDARSSGQLEQLYKKVNADLAAASGSSKQSLTAIATQIARQLAADKQAEIYQSIEDNRLPAGVVSLSLLQKLQDSAQEIKAWDESRWNDVQQRISTEKTATQTELSKQLLKVSQLPVDDLLFRINAMGVAAKMAGEGSQQEQNYLSQKEQAIVDWMSEADRALASREYTLAATHLRKVLGLDPNNQEAQEKLSRSEQQGFEAAFRAALEDSKPDLALSELKRIAASPVFEEVKGSLTNSIDLLHDYFINLGLQSSSQGALKAAYRNFSKAREIKQVMNQEPQRNAEVDYLNKLMNFAATKGQQKAYGEQLAYLEVVNQFNPELPKAREALANARKTIVEYASTSMLVQDFSQTGTHHSAGKSVAKQVFAWVFDNMPGQVALVNAQQMSQADTTAPGRILTLEGDILQAGVESQSSNSKKIMRVTTETKRTPNPEYKEWVEDGRKGTAPQEFFVEEKKEDVEVTVNHASKTGILSVSYRLIDQKTGQVLLNQPARDQQIFEGEGNEGIAIGEFNMPYKRPEVPSDIEIMERLSSQVALQIGEQLQKTLQASDQRYETLGDRALAQGKLDIARNYFGYAAAIRSLRGQNTDGVLNKLITAVMETN